MVAQLNSHKLGALLPVAALKVEVLPTECLDTVLQCSEVLMVIDFSRQSGVEPKDPRHVCVGLRPMAQDRVIEVWKSSGTVSCGRHGDIFCSQDDNYLFGHISFDVSNSFDLDVAVKRAYDQIHSFVRSSSYPYLFRFWNYIPHINQIVDHTERYQSFCAGRYAACSIYPEYELSLPAASAVGTLSSEVLITFAAAKYKTSQLENPRQISAFRYPKIYSPKSPLFSRSVCMNHEVANIYQLYVSGTASIVGHETQHVGSLAAQAEETFKNIDALLHRYADILNVDSVDKVLPVSLRFYIRNVGQFEALREIVDGKWPGMENIIFLEADICRRDLLLEVEGLFCCEVDSLNSGNGLDLSAKVC